MNEFLINLKYYFNPSQFIEGWGGVFTAWWTVTYISSIFDLHKQAAEETWFRRFLEGNFMTWGYVSFLFVPFVIFITLRAIFLSF